MLAAATITPTQRGFCGVWSCPKPLRHARSNRSAGRVAAPPARTGTRLSVRASQQDDEFAVFRFTLGIPGFDDEDIPRVVGFVGASLLLINHLASANPSDAQVCMHGKRTHDVLKRRSVAGFCENQSMISRYPLPSSPSSINTQTYGQGRTELIGAALSAVCVATPAIGRRLNESGAGVKGGTLDVAGGEQVFAFSPAVEADTSAKADMAWGTFALLTQTNAQGVILHRDGDDGVVCARGSVRLPTTGTGVLPGPPESIVAALSQSIAASGLTSTGTGPGAGEGSTSTMYFRDRSAIDRAGANEWGFIPQGAESVLVQRAGPDVGVKLLLISDKPRAFSKKQRAWVAAIADKLAKA